MSVSRARVLGHPFRKKREKREAGWQLGGGDGYDDDDEQGGEGGEWVAQQVTRVSDCRDVRDTRDDARQDPASGEQAVRRNSEFASLGSHDDVSRYHFVPREESLSRRTRVSTTTTTTTGIERETSRCVRRRSLTRECEYCARLRDRVRRPLPPQRSTEIAERGRVAHDPPTESRDHHIHFGALAASRCSAVRSSLRGSRRATRRG